MENNKQVQEKILSPRRGGMMLLLLIVLVIASVGLFVGGGTLLDKGKDFGIAFIVVGVILLLASIILITPGFKVIAPNEAVVLLFFGKYYGTIAKDGFFWVNPFCSVYNPAVSGGLTFKTDESDENKTTINLFANKKLSLKAMTLNNAKQKVNDEEGNPIEIGVVVIWRIINPAKAVFNVDNYMAYISTQADSAIRNVARSYPYDVSEAGDEKSLRGSSQEISEVLKAELQERVEVAGIEIMEARITHLAYAPEIAAAMLQRQQAKAIIVARQKIVEGAVGMVEMALNKLGENDIVKLDDKEKAQMVSNLLVVLCGSKDAQPVVNSGTI